jgi:hypothetical protein
VFSKRLLKTCSVNEIPSDKRKAIHELSRNDSNQSLPFVPFRVVWWISFSAASLVLAVFTGQYKCTFSRASSEARPSPDSRTTAEEASSKMRQEQLHKVFAGYAPDFRNLFAANLGKAARGLNYARRFVASATKRNGSEIWAIRFDQ